MANYSYVGYEPGILTLSGGTGTLSGSYDPNIHRRVFDVNDAAGGNTLGGSQSRPDLGLVFDGDRYRNEIGDDLTQTGTAESLDGSITYASGNIYLEQSYTLSKPGGGTLTVYRVEVDGTLVGYISSEPLVPGTNYSYTTSNVVPLNAPDTSDPTAIINVPCFTAGTLIRTPNGDVPIEHLKVGDAVVTLDNGPQKIEWIGKKHLGHGALLHEPRLRPVLVREGLFGATRDLLVSPQHGILVDAGHFVRAKHLAEAPKSKVRVANGKRQVTYIHLLFEQHQVVFSNGVASESLYPGKQALGSFTNAAQEELLTLFPELGDFQPDGQNTHYGGRARMFAKQHHLI